MFFSAKTETELVCKKGRPPVKDSDANDDDDLVVIPTQNKDVCKVCDSVTWKHTSSGAYFKWCKGCKRFHEIHAFAGKLKAAKCDDSRARCRAGPATKRRKSLLGEATNA